MIAMLLALIYAAFISLGLPDSLLGAAWPVMQPSLGIPFGFAGFVSLCASGGTILSSLLSGRVIRRFGTANTTRFSVLLTAIALFGYSQAPSFHWLLVFAIPLGLGAGAVDSALNHFVAAHFKAHHMNWLHCFWGIGALTGPLIMAGVIRETGGWRTGYLIVGLIQSVLVVLLFTSMPLWRAVGDTAGSTQEASGDAEPASRRKWLTEMGALSVLVPFLLYTGAEITMSLWGSSFLVKTKGMEATTAAFWASMFFASITIGRLLSGFLSMKLRNATLIRAGLWMMMVGALILALPLPAGLAATGFLLFGLGCAPVFPSMLHETPNRFGPDAAASLMGMQMAAATTGATFLPPLFGLVSGSSRLWLFPFVLLAYGALLVVMTERTNRIFTNRPTR